MFFSAIVIIVTNQERFHMNNKGKGLQIRLPLFDSVFFLWRMNHLFNAELQETYLFKNLSGRYFD